MAEELAPIETAYRGYRFRSRLEARWAVYFDTLEYRWEYEPEGFHLPSGEYLPDFRVDADRAGYPTWWEVKPSLPAASAHRPLDPRWVELVHYTQLPVVVTFGLPGPDDLGWPALVIGRTADGCAVQTQGLVTDWNRAAFVAARSARFERHGTDPSAQPRDHMQRAAGDR